VSNSRNTYDDDVDYEGGGADFVDDEDAATAPEYEDVVDFAHTCPTSGWSHEGLLNGGDQFTWSGYAAWTGYKGAWCTAKLHLHQNGNGTCNWGGLWIDGWTGSGISINGEAPTARDHLTAIVQSWLTTNALTLANPQ
jgi:hypothetical protein